MVIAVDAIFENGVLKPRSPVDLPERSEVRLTIETPVQTSMSDLGRRLHELRKEIVASAEPLLDWDEIRAEVSSRRGGWQGE